MVRCHSNLGEFDLFLLDSEKPATVANFLGYIERGGFTNSIIHRSVPGFVVQGGGFQLSGNSLSAVKTVESVVNEPGISNLRGTVAMAKLGGDPNSATSQWFVNLDDNSANLDAQNGGFTVFGRVLGNGMDTVDAIARLGTYDARAILGDAFGDLPLRAASLTVENLVLFPRVRLLADDTVVEEFDFADGWNGFGAGFADLPNGYDPAQYDLVAEPRPLPENLGGGNALFLSGVNRDDDLWIFVKRKITGLKADTVYRMTMDLEFASSVPAGLVGAGGAPAESVFVKCGASTDEPLVVVDSSGWLRMSIDKGQQSRSGKDALVVGDIAKIGLDDGTYASVRRSNRAFAQEVSADAAGNAWIFLGIDSGYEGATSLFLRNATVILSPDRPVAEEFLAVPGSYAGVFESGDARGILTIQIGKNGAWTGSVVINGARTRLQGLFAEDGTSSIPWKGLSGSLFLKAESIGLLDGKRDAGDKTRVVARLPILGGTDVLLFPTAESGAFGTLATRSVNVLLQSQGSSGILFGHGFARATIGRDGTVKWSGRLADGSPLAGSSRITEDWSGGLSLPVSIGIGPTKGLLQGSLVVVPPVDSSTPESHFFSQDPLSWVRPPNGKGRSHQAGFLEKLDATGRVWRWGRGTSALGGNITCDLRLTRGDGTSWPDLQAFWNADNKPVWSTAPTGFEFRCNPSTGAVSGKMPLEGRKKSAYQGLLFPAPTALADGDLFHGGGYVSGDNSSGVFEIFSR